MTISRDLCHSRVRLRSRVLQATRTVTLGLAVAVLLTAAGCQMSQPAGESTTELELDFYLAGTDVQMDMTSPPEPGQSNFLGGDIYLLDDSTGAPRPDGEPIGRFLGQCTVITARERTCTGLVTLDGRGTISVQVAVAEGVNQGIALTGGTGEFHGARGSGTEPSVPGHPEDRLLHLTLSTTSSP